MPRFTPSGRRGAAEVGADGDTASQSPVQAVPPNGEAGQGGPARPDPPAGQDGPARPDPPTEVLASSSSPTEAFAPVAAVAVPAGVDAAPDGFGQGAPDGFEQGAPSGDGDAAQAPAGSEPSAGPAEPGFGERGRLRRRLRFLRRARELAFRDLGGLIFDLHRFGRQRDDLVAAKLGTLTRIDGEMRALEVTLDDTHDTTVLYEAGVAACPRCGSIHGSDANFCPHCGLPVGRKPKVALAAAAGSGAASESGAGEAESGSAAAPHSAGGGAGAGAGAGAAADDGGGEGETGAQ